MFVRRLLAVLCVVCVSVVLSACGGDDSPSDDQDTCETDFECGLGFECSDEGFCVEITGEDNNDQPDAGEAEDTGGTDEDTGGADEDTGNDDAGNDADDAGNDTGDDAGDAGNDADDTGDDDTGTPDTGTPDTGTPDTGTPDTGTPDTGTPDTGTPDTGTPDTGTPDTGTPDTGMPDTGTPDTGTDAGTVAFSGCTLDIHCDGYQTCNTSIGRCEDSRTACETDTQCGFNEVCFGGRCTDDCSTTFTCPTGLSCIPTGSDDVCLALCDGLQAASGQCSPDTQCIPYFGQDLGLCRGVGQGDVGDTCTEDFSETGCQEGNYCINRRDELTCEPMCASSGGPSCGTGEFCLDIFPVEDDPSLNAGICLSNCGGLGSADDTLCGSGQGCQPLSQSEGYCTPQGTATEGSMCTFDGTINCETGTYCLPTGIDAATNPSQGVCTSYCDPQAISPGCATGEACFQFDNDPAFGICQGECDPSLTAASNSCTTDRPRCLPSDGAPNATKDGSCSASGNLATGAGCALETPLECNPNSMCVVANSSAEPFGGGSEGAGNCATYCLTDFGATPSRCGTGEVCAIRYQGLGVGFCTTNTTSVTMGPGTTCSSLDEGKWCDDSTICLDWFGTGTPRCEMPCDTTIPGTCPSTMSCGALQSGDTFGICQ